MRVSGTDMQCNVMKISVIIPARDEEKHIGKCLDSMNVVQEIRPIR